MNDKIYSIDECRRINSGPGLPTRQQIREYGRFQANQGALLGSACTYFLVAFLSALNGHPWAAGGFVAGAFICFFLFVGSCHGESEWLKGKPEIFQ